ncbi:Mutant cadherin [Operophtera brumata]|uniref:Mutant cadherin n=1 Tax=Operophtera brumata TaxID=104452 RepID=A0A0L7K362_OPEBR|nr:Mutant cadherin [Operophtera brumata]
MASSSSVVKCNSCNIVINETLAFIQNKLDVMDEESLVRICVSSFPEDEIEAAKTLLFESVPGTKRKVKRKNTGKSQRDLYDVITLFKETDPEKHPIFVARDLQKLPPINFDHVDPTKLLKDLLLIQRDVRSIMENYVTAEQLIEVKNDIDNLREASMINNFDRNVNRKRGGGFSNSFTLDSGPMGLPHLLDERNLSPQPRESPTATGRARVSFRAHAECAPGISVPLVVKQSCVGAGNEISEVVIEGAPTTQLSPSPAPPILTYRAISPSMEAVTLFSNISAKPAASIHAPRLTQAAPRDKSFSSVLGEEGEWKKEDYSEDWKLIQRKRLKNRFVTVAGKAETNPSEKFRAADISIPLFINNVDKSTSEKDIYEYILKKTQLEVNLQRINARAPKHYNAYKVFVPRSKMSIFLEDSFWPEGISYRRFIEFKKDLNNG